MSEPDSSSEDRRQPKAMMPYLVLWATTAVCVIFALFSLAGQG